MSPPALGEALLDRAAETEAIDRLLAAARGGSSRSLVLRGEPGIGKSTLLAYAADSAAGMRVMTVVGLESELEFSFAGLHRLLEGMLEWADELPLPQRDALASVFGRAGGARPDRFLVGLGVLGLLSNVAQEQPLVCVVDDAHYLDQASAQILSFVARRLQAEPIGLLFAVGDAAGMPFEGLPVLSIEGLSETAARELLTAAARTPINRHVRDRLISETLGNPLALLELSDELTSAQLSGSAALPGPLPMGERLARGFVARIRRLPSQTRTLLLLIAAEPSGEADLLWRAADDLGVDPQDLHPAEAAGLIRIGPPLRFRHSFVRSTVYARASLEDRQRIHEALAAATDPELDPDRKAWHRAAAAVVPDEALAGELQRSAGMAQARGGFAAAGALLQRAAELTPDHKRRSERFLEAAQTQLSAGAVETASALVGEAASGVTDDLQRALAQRLDGAIELARGSGADVPQTLLQAADALVSFDARMARDTYLEALAAAIYAGPLGRAGAVVEVAQAARKAPTVPKSRRTAADSLLEGFALLATEGHGVAEPALRAGIESQCEHGDLRSFGLAYQAAFELWDDAALLALATRYVQRARDAGALSALPSALSQMGGYEVLVGRLAAAEAAFEESGHVAAATGNPGVLGQSDVGAMIVAAWRGRASVTRGLAKACAGDGAERGLGVFVSYSRYAIAILELGSSHYQAALAAADEAAEDFIVATRTLPELVEAAVMSGERELAEAATERLAETTLPRGTEWGLGMLARSRALVAEPDDAEALYREAIERLQRCRVSPQLARARLVYGEWLRRARRRRHAREPLTKAHQMFVSIGARAFAKRAEAELAATGKPVRRPSLERLGTLTPHEFRVARLVTAGATNREVAAQLYISPRTVEYHLHKVFKKLGITSRTQLTRALFERERG